MANTLIDVDEEALEKARLFYGTTTKRDTINRALRDAAARRNEQVSALGTFLLDSVAEFEGMRPHDQEALRRSWMPPERDFESFAADSGRSAL